MDITKIVSITGKPGLFKLVAQMKNGVIVESLTDGKRTPAHASSQISALNDISIYCTDGDKPFSEVLQSIFVAENGKPADIDANDNSALKTWFVRVVPNYDQERVYVSDIRKTLKWYNALQSAGLLEAPVAEEKKEETGELPVEKPKKTKSDTAAKKTATKKSDAPAKPAKSLAAKTQGRVKH